MKTIHLKILPEYFEAVKDGRKTFELRKDDRDYKVGDILVLHEFDGNDYTRRSICREITYILKDCEKYGLKDGYCILGIKYKNMISLDGLGE